MKANTNPDPHGPCPYRKRLQTLQKIFVFFFDCHIAYQFKPI